MLVDTVDGRSSNGNNSLFNEGTSIQIMSWSEFSIDPFAAEFAITICGNSRVALWFDKNPFNRGVAFVFVSENSDDIGVTVAI